MLSLLAALGCVKVETLSKIVLINLLTVTLSVGIILLIGKVSSHCLLSLTNNTLQLCLSLLSTETLDSLSN